MNQLENVKRKFEILTAGLTERSRRLWAGAEATALGRGGIALVARATGMAISTVRKGRDEVRDSAPVPDLVVDRRSGAGPKRLEEKDPQLVAKLERLVSPTTRGDPESVLRWSIKSTRALARELTAAGHRVSPQKIGELLRERGYSLQGTSRVKEGAKHPDRNAQFEHIKSRAEKFIQSGQPVISVDAKKKEFVGEYGRAGQEWQPKGKPVEVETHDFFHEKDSPRAIPYGVYDVAANAGFVNVGIDHDTPRFAVQSIEKWWELMGKQRYPSASALYITADAGGSNSAVSHVWKAQLQNFADRSGMKIEVSHFPPGTSKWNKIEHRLFSFITLNWRGRPLTSYEIIIALIGATTTRRGLVVEAHLDENSYPLGDGVPKHLMAQLALERATFHGEWNYTIQPRSEEQRERTAASHPPPHRDDSRARWVALVEEQIASGLNSSQFCKKHGLNYDTFICARRRLKGVLRPKTSISARISYLIRKASPAKD